MSTAVDAAIVELEAALAEVLPIQEGLADYLRVNILQPARIEVTAAKALIDRRASKIQAALEGCRQLVSDGYPEIPTRPVEADVLADLRDQQATIAAALAKFTSAQASTLVATVGEPTLKA